MVRQSQLGAGFTLARCAMRAWSTPQFWKYLGWWHQEVHYDIPFDREVREMEKALSECFGEVTTGLYGVVGTSCINLNGSVSNVNISNCNFNLPVNIAASPNFTVSTNETGQARIDCLRPGSKSVGSYQIPDVNIVLPASRKPGLLRRLVLGSLLGIHWADEKKKSEYVTRLLKELGGNS